MRLALLLLSTSLLGACAIDTSDPGAPSDPTVSAMDSPADAHVTWTRETSELRARRSPNMTFHGGKIMATAVTKNIFWGTSWANYTGDKMTGLDAWFTGYSNSKYSGTVTEFTGSNGAIGKATTHQGHVVDTSAASGGNNTGPILTEVCKMITGPDAAGNGFYSVYTDLPRGNAGFCAWHASGKCGSTTVQFAFFWNLDGDAGCDPTDTSGLHSQGLGALANVTGHELSEARTDPSTTSSTGAGGWFDSSGAENGDKCAWTWGAPLISFSDGSQWKVQGEWSNAAFTAGTGYPNRSGQNGCLGGQ